MKRVYKYQLYIMDYQSIHIPKGASILHIGFQGNNDPYTSLYVWALVDPDIINTEKRTFRIAGTGHDIIEENAIYIGTLFLAQGALVFHVFEV